MSEEHTKTPWRTFDNDANATEIMGADGPMVAMTYDGHGIRDINEAEANARFIVKAVNSHDALIGAARAVRQRHTLKAKQANFDDCGCNDCLTLGPALALADKDS